MKNYEKCNALFNTTDKKYKPNIFNIDMTF